MNTRKQHKPNPVNNRQKDTSIRPSAPQIARMNKGNPGNKVSNADFDSDVKLNQFGAPAFIQPRNTVQARLKDGNDEKTKDREGPEKSFPFKGYINRNQVGFHKKPQPGVDVKKDWIRPDLRMDEEVKVVGVTWNNWYIVERMMDGEIVKGYVDYRYITKIQQVDLKEVDIIRLSKQKVQQCCDDVADLYMEDLVVSNADVTKVLEKLKTYYNDYHPSDFARIAICLKKRGALDVLLSNINRVHIENYFETLSYISVFAPLGSSLDMMEGVITYEGGKEAMGNFNPIDFFRMPTPDNQNPVESMDGVKENLKKRALDKVKAIAEELMKDKEAVYSLLDKVLKNTMELKAYELEIYWARKDYMEVTRIILEMNQLAEGGMEILFSKAAKGSIANRWSVQLLLAFINMFKSEIQAPTLNLDANPKTPLTDFYDAKTGKLIDPSKQTGGTQNQGPTPEPDPEAEAAAKFRDEVMDFVKQIVIRLAESMHVFFHNDMVDLMDRSPGLLNYFNAMISGPIRSDAYSKLSEDVKINDSTTKLTKETLRNMDWIDLARVWQYELGDPSLGNSEDNAVVFSKYDKTTKDLRSHPSLKTIEGYARARVNAGDRTPFMTQVKYDVSGFWNAVSANDVAFNFLGSFKVTVTPIGNGDIIQIEAYNKSSRSSGSRFRRDPDKPSSDNKIGIFDDVERTPKGKKSKDVALGGNIHQKWRWRIKK